MARRTRKKDPTSALLEEVKLVAAETPAAKDIYGALSIEGREELKAQIMSIKEETALELARTGARSAQILEALGVPPNLEGADAEAWCNEEIQRMRVIALSYQKYLLLHGTPSQSARASEKILEITEKDKGLPSVAPIIIINGSGGAAVPPWRKMEVVDAKQVDNVAALQASPRTPDEE